MRLDHVRIGHELNRQPRGQVGAHAVVSAPDAAPLLALPLETVHVEHDALAGRAQQQHRRHVGQVAHVDHVPLATKRMNRREQGVHDGLEVLAAWRGQSNDAHPAVTAHGLGHPAIAAVDGDFMAARTETRAEFLGECLEAAVARRHSACAEEGQTHLALVFGSYHPPDASG